VLYVFLCDKRFSFYFVLFFSDYLSHFFFYIISPLKSCQKKLDFRLKVIGGELSAIPGISDALEVR
jgi:hypothetical protein